MFRRETCRRPVLFILAVVLIATGCSAVTTPKNSAPVSGGRVVHATGNADPTDLPRPSVGGNYPQALAATQ